MGIAKTARRQPRCIPGDTAMTNLIAKASQLLNCHAGEAFDAFVDPGKITQFWLESTTAPLSEHSEVTWSFMVPGAVETVVVDEFQPAELIAFTWSDGLKVRLEFSEQSVNKTRVSAEVQGFSGDDAIDHVVNATEGFSIVLCDLKTFLESGQSAGLVRAKAELIAASVTAAKSDDLVARAGLEPATPAL
jgi:uncharacterized protein YndB with AHSA1/START domain